MIFSQWLFYYLSLWFDTFLFEENEVYSFYSMWFCNYYTWMGNIAVAVIVLVIDPSFLKLGKMCLRIKIRYFGAGEGDFAKVDPYGIHY